MYYICFKVKYCMSSHRQNEIFSSSLPCLCVFVCMCVSRRTSKWSVHLGCLAKGWTIVVLFELNAKILCLCVCVCVWSRVVLRLK